MGLLNALNAANSGLRATESGLAVVSRNIANADTPGYTKKSLAQNTLTVGGASFGVESTSVQRSVNAFLQTQLRLETSQFNGLSVRQEFLGQIDQMFGEPGAANALDTLVNSFSQSLQQLAATPESFASRETVIADAATFAQQLRQLSGGVQAQRQNAEDLIADAVIDVNAALEQLAVINGQVVISGLSDLKADILDERDKLIDQVAGLLEIKVHERDNGAVLITTASGNTLLDGQAAQLSFDRRGNIGAQSLYSTNPADRGVGTLALVSPNGLSIDLLEQGILSDGRIGTLIELRDTTLVETQAQLDELAHSFALALSTKTVDGTAASAGLQTGLEVDTAGLQPGNPITLTYTTTPPGTPQTVSIIRVDDPTKLPLANTATADPNDTVIGVDFSGGIAAAAATIDAALGAGVTVSSPSGDILRFLDDGAAATTDIDALSVAVTSTSLQDDGTQLPLFVDLGTSSQVYSGSLDGSPQKLGFAGRISVNQAIAQDNELLVRYATSPQTPLGDTARPLDLIERLNEQAFTFDPASGIGQVQDPFDSTVMEFAQRVVSFQTGQADLAERELASQDIVVSALRERHQADIGVDVNSELSQLITLQNAFAANARIIQAIDEMMQMILRI
jgi:flagellar hook-associated protein 1 FlgK